jgi:hypothetical protein
MRGFTEVKPFSFIELADDGPELGLLHSGGSFRWREPLDLTPSLFRPALLLPPDFERKYEDLTYDDFARLAPLLI